VAALPRTVGGKIDTARLPLPETTSTAQATPLPTDATTALVQTLMAQTLGLDSIAPDDRFHDLGGHSLLAVRLLGRIEAELGKRVTLPELHCNPSPRALGQLLSSTTATAAATPQFIIPIHAGGTATPLFGVHVLGRNEEHFRPLSKALGPDHPVYGLTVGPLTSETPVGVEATAKLYFQEIMRHHPEGPICLAAVSLASYFAVELAHQLLAAGRKVEGLILFDASGPHGRSGVRGLERFRVHGRRLMRDGLRHPMGILANRVDDLRIRLERARLARKGSWGEGATPSVSAFIAANEQAVAQYVAQPLDVPLTIFRAEENHFDSPQDIQSGLGWAAIAAAGFDLIDTPGGHLTMLQPPNVSHLAQNLARVLKGARES
jgi:thioesterase domain-containing protein/acyl carrier protein